MHWNCPHCGTRLALADEKIGPSWGFSRCFRCAGFALIRSADKTIVKVDRAPLGERILLPEATEQPMLSRHAQTRLTQYTQPQPLKPEIRPAVRKSLPALPTSRPVSLSEIPAEMRPRSALAAEAAVAAPILPATLQAKEPAAPVASQQQPAPAVVANPFTGSNVNGLPFPAPLPDIPERSGGSKLLSVAIGIAGAAAVGSGIYLYVQGQSLWKKTHLSSSARPIEHLIQKAAAVVPVAPVTDAVHERAMAPERIVHEIPQSLMVRPKLKDTYLRQGPGMVFTVTGIADVNSDYIVIDWSDRWFKVVPRNQKTNSGWIRTDAVQLVAQEAPSPQEISPPSP